VALTHLVDTSVLTRLHQPSVLAALEPMANAGRIGRAAVSDLEIGYSARNSGEWDRLVAALDIFEAVNHTAQHFVRALQVQRMLAARSQRGRKVPDLLIAAAAESMGLAVLHYDSDFDLIAAVTEQQCDWIVPAGSVD
jgi:predicted nucleic acid-binding protein